MSKLTLNDLANLSNESTAINTINENNSAIETALETVLSRDGTTPNVMSTTLDMNSYRIINLSAPIYPGEPVRKQELDNLVFNGTYVYEAANMLPAMAGNALKYPRVKADETGYELVAGLPVTTGNADKFVQVNSGGTGYQLTSVNLLPDPTGNALKYVRVNTGANGYEVVTLASPTSSYTNVAAIKALVGGAFDTSELVYLKGSSDPFVVLSGTAASNGYTADDALVIQNTANTYTFVRQLYVISRIVDARWWNPPLDGTSDAYTQLNNMLTTVGALASSTNQVTCRINSTYCIGTALSIPDYVTLDGQDVGVIKPRSSLGLTQPLLKALSAPSGNTRVAIGIKVRNLILDGSNRSYPQWLTNPTNGAVISNPSADYSSPGVLNAGLYPGGINDVVTANRRNPNAITVGYLTYFIGVIDLEVKNCVFRNHGSCGLAAVGCSRAYLMNNYFTNVGTISWLSPSIMCIDYGSAWPITAISKANPAMVTLNTSTSISNGQTIRLKDISWAGQLADGAYTAGTVSGNTITLSGINSTGYTSTFNYDGYALLTTDTFIPGEDCVVQGNTFVNINRIGIQAGGRSCVVSNNYVRGAREGGIFLSRMFDGDVTDNVIEDITISDLVANGIEVNYCTNTRIAHNVIRRVDGTCILNVGHHRCQIVNNKLYRSGSRGAVNYQYGPLSERYNYGSPPQLAGTPLTSEEKAPIRLLSYAGIPLSGKVCGNFIEDNRLTPWQDAAIVCLRSGGAGTETINNLEIADNDFTTYPTSNVNSLIDYGTSAIDAQTVIVRRNKKHPSQSAFFDSVVAYASGTTGDQTITCNFPPSAVEIVGLQSATAPPFRLTFGAGHKTHAAQGSSAFHTLSVAGDPSDSSTTTNTNTFAQLRDSAGVVVWAATFVRWEPTGLTINISTSSVGCVLQVRCYT